MVVSLPVDAIQRLFDNELQSNHAKWELNGVKSKSNEKTLRGDANTARWL